MQRETEADLSIKNVHLIAALLLGTVILLAVHTTGYVVGRRKIESSRGEGTMTPAMIRDLRDEHLLKGSLHVGLWVAGVGTAKVILVLAARSAQWKAEGREEKGQGGTPTG